jgi:hypothetical protein
LLRRPAIVACLVLVLPVSERIRAQQAGQADLASKVQPLLKNKCYSCHDARKHRAGLRLDDRAGALRGGESGKPAVVPGKSAASELVRRITSQHEEERMPSKKSPLSAMEISLLRTWIDQGAPWPGELAGSASNTSSHWAFRPPTRTVAPAVANPQWPRSALDRFVLARLEKEGMRPSPEADRVTLIRRLSLDLIGLPPSIAEVDGFLADKDPCAYEHLVDRLLDSPHYGERWGRHWLDAARYADSDGFEKDKSRQVWFYRDWVINALNRDLPFDEFIIEQIAGDLLPNATQGQIVATGYLRNSMINEEGGIDPEQFRMEAMFDRMDAIGKGVLGLTIQCAQCHNHKYDPLTQIDYYRLFAFLNNCHEANAQVYTPLEQMARARVLCEIGALESDLRHRHADWRERMHRWEKGAPAASATWTILRPEVEDESTGGQKYLPMEDGSFLALGYAPTKHTVKMLARTEVKNITGFRLELLTDPNLPLTGPGRSIKGTGALTEFKVEVASAEAPKKPHWVKFAKATADVNPPVRPLESIFDDRSGRKRVTGPVTFAIDGKDETAWGIDDGPGRRNQPRKAVFLADKPISFPKGTIITFHLKQDHGGWNSDDNQNCNLGRIRLSITTQPGAEADPLPERVRQILAIAPERRTPAQEAAVFSYWRTTVPEWKDVNDRIEALWKSYPEGSAQLVLRERDQRRATHMLKRGDFLRPGQAVEPGVPDFLHPLKAGAPLTRLTFARWLVDRRSPTTARALVNRVWQAYFGTGFVATSEDLGTQCEPPSHPELLDWLAVEFMDHGWSLKHLHRLIVNSAAYRQSSRVTPELFARDPYNRLLARGPRMRVEGEIVRDIALDASGLLNREIGGRSVFPPLPEFMILPPVSYGPKIWPEDMGPERYRRGLYTFRYRSVPYPFLQTFDAPNGDAACVRRVRSNTPLQALVTLNEPVAMECARALAVRTLMQGGLSDSDKMVYAFRSCLGRSPTQSEASQLLGLLKKEQARFMRPGAKPSELVPENAARSPDLSRRPASAQAAAWTVVSRVLLNLDETFTKE